MTMTLAQLEALVTAQDAEIKRLRRDVGDFEKPIDLTKPPAELPNKEYPVAFRQRQLGVGIDSLTDTVAAGVGGSVSVPPASTSGAIEGDSAKLHGTGAAEMTLLSNEQGKDPQNPTHVHHNVLSGGNDGGFRMIQNGSFEDPTRPRSIFALDSMGEVSYSQDQNGVIDPSQSFVVKLDYARKVLMLCSMKPDWSWEIRESTVTNKFDRIVFP